MQRSTFALFIFILSLSAFTADLSTTAKFGEKFKEKIFKNMSAQLDLTYESNFEAEKSIDKTTGLSVEGYIRYQLNTDYRLQLYLVSDKSLKGAREAKTGNSKINLRGKTYSLSKALALTPSISGVIPTNKKNRDEDSLQTAFEFNPSFNYKINDFLGFSYLPRLKKNFHKYTTNNKNEYLSSYSLIQFAFVTYQFSDRFSFSPGLVYVSSWNYEGESKADSYISVLELSYRYDEKTKLNIGLETSGSVINNEKGEDEKVEIVDSKKSVGYLSFSRTF